MPFKKGNKLGKANAGKSRQSSKRTIWLLESLKEHGYDYESMLVKLLKSSDPHDIKLAELLIRMVPHIANAPKQDVTLDGVETLVINRYVKPSQDEGDSALQSDTKPE
jgi:hypothetical protein